MPGPGEKLSLISPAEKYCPREEKDIRRWKRYFPGKVLFHFYIPGIEKWKRTFPGKSLFHLFVEVY
jgi:hypothetical protein